ncbi:MAG TPA: GAF domain-containing protein, partial [Anaerolineales bacterium]|nr:GAF domain-containing protein [Anaerolineales bacterium]
MQPDRTGPQMDRDILQRVLEVSRLMAETRLLTPLLDRVMDEAVNLARAERGYLVLLRPDGSHEIRVRRGRLRDSSPVTTDEISNSIVDQVVRTAKPLIVHDAIGDPRFSNAMSIINLKLRSVMCVP